MVEPESATVKPKHVPGEDEPGPRHEGKVTIRRGDLGDAPAVMTMFDRTVEWLVANDRADQWGTEPWSVDPQKVERIRQMIANGDLWIAELEGSHAGALILSEEPMPYIEPATEPELYVQLLLTDPALRGHQVGARLLDHAKGEARTRGVALLRVDCFAGGDGKLVRYYESQGFTPVSRFEVKGWPGQLLAQRVR
ncbi:MAG: GNAT family N-acetyltransferase [Thermomicrobiales bacterium]